MKKRRKGCLKKLFAVIAGVMFVAGVIAYNVRTEEIPIINYDNKLLESGKRAVMDWNKIPGRTYSVMLEKENVYTADINGDIQTIILPPEKDDALTITNIEDINAKGKRVFNKATKKIIAYVKGSEILKDKEQILQELEKIEIKMATVDAPAMYKEGTIYVGREYADDVICEWMICHELIHAIAEITNHGIENEAYPYYMFNEGLTDMLTYTLAPEIDDRYISGYASYYDYIALYVGCFGEEAISAYFYGYDNLWSKVGKEEFDFWVYALENLYDNKIAEICVNNFLNKWACAL